MSDGMDKGGKRLKTSESLSVLGENDKDNMEDNKYPEEENKRSIGISKDQIDKKDYIIRRPVKKWEKRWVL